METIYNPDLKPLDFNHSFSDNHSFFSPMPTNDDHQLPTHTGPVVDLHEKNQIPSDPTPPNSPTKSYPRENVVRKSLNVAQPTALPDLKIQTEAKEKRRVRKKRKFRLVPTFKHLENGRFVGREKELNHLRYLLLNSSAINNKHSIYADKNAILSNYNKLSMVAITGASGVGKSSVAYVYLMAFESKYKYVFWLNANSILSDARDVLLYHIRNEHQVQAIKQETSAEIIRIRFLSFLSKLKSEWLLIIDDFNDTLVKVQEWIPQKMENLSVSDLHQVQPGHIIITSNENFTTVKRNFCNFSSDLINLDLDSLSSEENGRLIKHGFPTIEENMDEILENYCDTTLVLVLSLKRISGMTLREIHSRIRGEMDTFFIKRKHKLQQAFEKMDRDDLFDADRFEVELLLKKFGITKYLESLVTTKGRSNLNDLFKRNRKFYRDLTFKTRKKKQVAFDLRDEEKFIKMRKFLRNESIQNTVTCIMKLVVSAIRSNQNKDFSVQVIEILNQISWMGPQRIPLFLFPQLLVESFSAQGNNCSSSISSNSSSSTVTHNTNALSTFSLIQKTLPKDLNINTTINGSFRFNSIELDFLSLRGILSFLVFNNLIKMEKTGFISCSYFIQKALIYLQTEENQSFDNVIQVLKKFHHLGFEVNFDQIVGESLSFLKLNPEFVLNEYNKIDLQFHLDLLEDSELQKYFTHDYNLKMNLLPHFQFLRRHVFRELNCRKADLRNYNTRNLITNDAFGVRYKNMRDFSKYIEFIQQSSSEANNPNLKKEVREIFNASRASFFPDFDERDLSLVKADLIYNEGLLILSIPFRRTKLIDAFNCFKTAYNVYVRTLSKQVNSRDLVLAKCSFSLATTLFRMNSLKDALTVFELSLRHFHDFHGEFTNHFDIARNLSSIGCVYHCMATTNSLNLMENEAGEAGISDLVTLEQARMKSSPEKIERAARSVAENTNVERLIANQDLRAIANESMKYHQLSVQMYRDIMGSDPLNLSYAKALMNRAKTLIVLDKLDEAEEDLLHVQKVYHALSIKSVVYREHLGNVSMNLANLALKKDHSDYEKFLLHLEEAMSNFSSFCKFESKVLNIKNKKVDFSEKEEKGFELTDKKLCDLIPHSLLCESLVTAAEMLISNNVDDSYEKAEVLLTTAELKYSEIFEEFQHPRLTYIQQRLLEVRELI